MGLRERELCPREALAAKPLERPFVKHWFALLVKPRHEKVVSAALRSKHYEEFLPLRSARRKWSDRVQTVEMPLLAGYTFCRFEASDKVSILRTPGVRKVVGWGPAPVPVQESEIQALQRIMQSGVSAAPCPYLRTGEPIRLDGGPLSGLQGLLLESRGRSRLVVSISLLQRSVSVEVEQSWITPTDLPPRADGFARNEPRRGALAPAADRAGAPDGSMRRAAGQPAGS
jgi:transcription antitermination factor NusG